jgi:hypothetical protein
MKTMKAFCTATVLALTLSVSAFAGDIASPGAAEPGDISTPGAVSTVPSTLSTDMTVLDSDLETAAWGDMFLTLVSLF